MLKTEDMAATLAWYERVGFEVRGRAPDDGTPTWLELERDGVVLQFLGGDTPWPAPPSLTGTLYFYPESVDDLHEHIRSDIEPDWGPEDREWGMRELGLRDPNGYFLTFTEQAR
jgi:catechol 2,3-dioxygenase-like lactoylglutathione lyase family enzyme